MENEHRVPSASMRARQGLVLGWAFVGVFAACIVVASINELTADDAVGGARAVDSFVDAWQRMRTETYLLDATYVRRAASTGVELPSQVVIAQRPPDRVVRQFGGISGRFDDQMLLCGARPDAEDATCELGEPGRSYEESVAREVDVLRTYVDGAQPLYSVLAAGDCYVLRRQRVQPLSPYGETARFCFDAATGSPRLIEIDHGNGVTETTTATEVRDEVRDEDLDVELPDRDGG
jgi:hypothetical protein